MSVKNDVIALALVAAALVAAAWYVKKKAGTVVADAANWVNEATVHASETVNTGVSAVGFGVGDLIGVPRTDLSKCDRAMMEGRTWDASFDCPAGTFIRYLGT